MSGRPDPPPAYRLSEQDAADLNATVEMPDQPVYDWTGVGAPPPAYRQTYRVRPHTKSDPRAIGGTLTHGGPNQFICGMSPAGQHQECSGCWGRSWYVEGADNAPSGQP